VSRRRRRKRRADILGVFIMVFAMLVDCFASLPYRLQLVLTTAHIHHEIRVGKRIEEKCHREICETAEITSTWELVLSLLDFLT
jgi:hypothetical protein